MLIPLVSVIAAITLLPAILSMLGTKVNSLRVLPKRFMDDGPSRGRLVGQVGRVRRPPPVADRRGRARDRRRARLLGLPAEPERGAGRSTTPARATRSTGAQALTAAGISAGVMKPFVVLVETARRSAADRRRSSSRHRASPARSRRLRGRRTATSLIEAFPADDGSSSQRARRRSRRSQGELDGTGARARRRRRRGARLRQRRLLELPVRARLRDHPDADPARAGVPVGRARR